MGDDIGYWNISVYNRGMMAYRTPNIDRIANEGAIFTDYRGQQPCTAGRAAFITGQSPLRTELPKVGLPGAKEGRRHRILRRELRSPASKTKDGVNCTREQDQEINKLQLHPSIC